MPVFLIFAALGFGVVGVAYGIDRDQQLQKERELRKQLEARIALLDVQLTLLEMHLDFLQSRIDRHAAKEADLISEINALKAEIAELKRYAA